MWLSGWHLLLGVSGKPERASDGKEEVGAAQEVSVWAWAPLPVAYMVLLCELEKVPVLWEDVVGS